MKKWLLVAPWIVFAIPWVIVGTPYSRGCKYDWKPSSYSVIVGQMVKHDCEEGITYKVVNPDGNEMFSCEGKCSWMQDFVDAMNEQRQKRKAK